ncbi:MAG TPA: hypothetical protein VGL29_11580 [Blastocatellia bacterium]|jgi:plasmid stability protein
MTLIINLPVELEVRLQREAARKGIAAEELARTLLEEQLQVKDGQPSQEGDAWSVLKSMMGTVEGPPDWSTELDHYLYGTPKRGEDQR